jgi:hypothetical protein
MPELALTGAETPWQTTSILERRICKPYYRTQQSRQDLLYYAGGAAPVPVSAGLLFALRLAELKPADKISRFLQQVKATQVRIPAWVWRLLR